MECLGPLIELGGYLYIIVCFFLGDIYFEFAIIAYLYFSFYMDRLLSVASTILLEAWSTNTYPKMNAVSRHVISMALTEIFWYKPLTLVLEMRRNYPVHTEKKRMGKYATDKRNFLRKEHLQ